MTRRAAATLQAVLRHPGVLPGRDRARRQFDAAGHIRPSMLAASRPPIGLPGSATSRSRLCVADPSRIACALHQPAPCPGPVLRRGQSGVAAAVASARVRRCASNAVRLTRARRGCEKCVRISGTCGRTGDSGTRAWHCTYVFHKQAEIERSPSRTTRARDGRPTARPTRPRRKSGQKRRISDGVPFAMPTGI